MAIVEYARNVANIPDANSGEFVQNGPNNVVDLMPEQEGFQETGGSMRLGAYPAILKEDSKIASIYGTTQISERHRHRYEVMNQYVSKLEEAGLVISGRHPERNLVETIELPDHPWFVACQFHPELKSKPLKPHPLFSSFLAAAYRHKQEANSE